MRKADRRASMDYYPILVVAVCAALYLFTTVQHKALVFWLRSVHSRVVLSRSASYTSGAPPVQLYLGKDIKNNLIYVDLAFSIDKLAGYQDLFQTANVNAGIRAEIDGSGHSGIAVTDDVTGVLKGYSFDKRLVPGHEYHLHVKAVNGRFITATLDGLSPEQAPLVPRYKINRILIGQGFTSKRKFHGRINAHIRIVEIGPLHTAQRLILGLRIALLLAFALSLYWLFRRHQI